METEYNWLFDNLKKARELLALTQGEAAGESGVKQMDISKLENYKKEFIPNKYILFLHKKGIDLHTIFDQNSCEVKFRAGNQVAPKSAPNLAPIGENAPLPDWVKDQLQTYDSRLNALEGNVEDINKRLPEKE